MPKSSCPSSTVMSRDWEPSLQSLASSKIYVLERSHGGAKKVDFQRAPGVQLSAFEYFQYWVKNSNEKTER